MNHWNDSLKTALDDLYELFKNLEVLQNEFEIDLLRLHSQGREQKKKMEYVEDDLVNQRVNIASNRQEMGGIDDTVSTLNEEFGQVRQKLDITANQSYILSGNLSTIKKDIQSIRSIQENQQNQINMMSGALANNIQEVIQVQGKFSNVENGVDENQLEIRKLNKELLDQTEELSKGMDLMLKDLTSQLESISDRIDEMDNNALKARKKLTTDLGDLTNELNILSDKVITLSRDHRVTDEKVDTINGKIRSIEGSIDKIDGRVIKIDDRINRIEGRVSDLKGQVDQIPLSKE